jgi:hypothetical protein
LNYSSPRWRGLSAALACAPSLVLAQGTVTAPGTSVPPVVYQSVFSDTPTGVEKSALDWTKANAEVGQFKRGHVDILKWEEAQDKDRTPAKPAAPAAPAAPGHHSH